MNNIIEQIKDIDIIEYIENEGFTMKRVGSNAVRPTKCPFCGDSPNGHFTIDTSKNRYKSFGANCGCNIDFGSVIDFVMEYNQVEQNEAIKILKGYLGLDDSDAQDKKQRKVSSFKSKKESSEDHERKRYNFDDLVNKALSVKQDNSYFKSRGLNDATIKAYRLINDPKGFNHLVGPLGYKVGGELYTPFGYVYHYFIPLVDETGTVVSFVSRANDAVLEDTINKCSANNPDFSLKKTHNIKGVEMLPFNIRCLADTTYMVNRNDKRLFICEGIFDALSFINDNKNAISSNSANNYNKVLKYIEKYKDNLKDFELILCGDDDLEGHKFNDNLFELIKPLGLKVEILTLPEGYHDVNECYCSNIEAFKFVVDGVAPTVPFNGKKPSVDYVDKIDDEGFRRNFDFEMEQKISEGYTVESNYEGAKTATIANDMLAAGIKVSTIDYKEKLKIEGSSLRNRFRYSRANKRKNKSPLKTGFKGIDDVLKFLSRKIIGLGAIPGAGKTTLCLNIAVNLAKQKKHSIFYSLELDRAFVEAKILSSLSVTEKSSTCFLDAEKIFNYMQEQEDCLSPCEEDNLEHMINICETEIMPYLIIDDFIDRANFKIADRTIESIVNHTKDFMIKNADKGITPVIFIDYIQQVEAENDRLINDKQRIDYIAKKLIDMKKLLGVTIFLISSLNRDSYTEVISEISFKESGALEYACDLLLGISWRDMAKLVEESESKSALRNKIDEIKSSSKVFKRLEMIVVKNRNGYAGQTIPLTFYGAYHQFTNGDEKLSLREIATLLSDGKSPFGGAEAQPYHDIDNIECTTTNNCDDNPEYDFFAELDGELNE